MTQGKNKESLVRKHRVKNYLRFDIGFKYSKLLKNTTVSQGKLL